MDLKSAMWNTSAVDLTVEEQRRLIELAESVPLANWRRYYEVRTTFPYAFEADEDGLKIRIYWNSSSPDDGWREFCALEIDRFRVTWSSWQPVHGKLELSGRPELVTLLTRIRKSMQAREAAETADQARERYADDRSRLRELLGE